MNIKKILVLLLFAIAIIGIISPVSAQLNGYVSKYDGTSNNKLFICVSSDIGVDQANWKSSSYVKQRKGELNKIKKITVKIDGYKTVGIKSPSKGWSTYKYADAFEKSFTVKGVSKSLNGKKYYIKFYDKQGKLLKKVNSKLKLK